MIRVAVTAVLLGAFAVSASAAPPAPQVFEGRIRDVRGTDGTLTLTLREGEEARDRMFLITEARIKGPTGLEWKVGNLRVGERVQVELTPSGRMVRVIRVLPR